MTALNKETVLAISAALSEPEWMKEFRLAAWDCYEQTPMPTTKDEPWRRTDLRRLKIDDVGPSLNGNGHNVTIPSYLGEQLTEDKTGGILVQVDGVTRDY
jgi:Fe-S cluster assembly protein SufD